MATTINLTPAEIDITVEQETDNTLRFQLKKYDLNLNQWVAENITNDAVKFTARDDFGGSITIATKTNAAGSHFDAVNGYTQFTLTKLNTKPNDRSSNVTWRYEVRRVIAGTSEEVVYLKGKLILQKTVGL